MKIESGEVPHALAEAIDRLMSVDVSGRGFIAQAYAVARQRAGAPLVQVAGDSLLKAIAGRKGAVVFIVTGATSLRPGLPPHIGETDGPAGAVALARSLALACGVAPILLTDPGQATMLSQAAQSLGLYTLPPEAVILQATETAHAGAVAVLEIAASGEEADAQAVQWIEAYSPVAAIAIEKASPNDKGVFHNSSKVDTTIGKARAERIFQRLRAAGTLTIGIGDGGNEIGMGAIREELAQCFPELARCACPCGGEVLASEPTDCLITAAVSNWGGYALSAYLSYMRKMPYAAHSSERERRLLEGCARAGYMDLNGLCAPGADALPSEIHQAFVKLLSALVLYPALDLGRQGFLDDLIAR